MKKNSCTPINPKKYSCKGLKKIHTRNLIRKKNSCSSKIPLPPPHNFSNGPSLISEHEPLTEAHSGALRMSLVTSKPADVRIDEKMAYFRYFSIVFALFSAVPELSQF